MVLYAITISSQFGLDELYSPLEPILQASGMPENLKSQEYEKKNHEKSISRFFFLIVHKNQDIKKFREID